MRDLIAEGLPFEEALLRACYRTRSPKDHNGCDGDGAFAPFVRLHASAEPETELGLDVKPGRGYFRMT